MANPAFLFAHTTRRSPLTRTLRVGTPGNRRRNMVLSSGRRIIKRGARSTQLSMAEVEDNRDRLNRWVRCGLLELRTPEGEIFQFGAAPAKIAPPPPPLPPEEPELETEVEETQIEAAELELPKKTNGRVSLRGRKKNGK